MLETILKYWLTWVMGLIAAGLGVAAKKFYSLYQSEKHHQKTEEWQKFNDDLKKAVEDAAQISREEERKLQDQIRTIQTGVLSLQGRAFKQECRDFLEPDREFTLQEYEALQEEHEIYNQLGGNHQGDTLFKLVVDKAKRILTDDK